MRCIHATIPWPRKRAMPKPPELEDPGLLPQFFVSRDQRLRLRGVPRAVRGIQRRFFSCRPSARSMLRG